MTLSRRPHAPGRRLPVLLCVSALALAGGCFKKWGRDLGGAAVETVQDRSAGLLGPLRDSIFAIAGRTYDDSLRPRLDASVAGVLDTVELRTARLEDSLADFVEDRLNEALRALVDSNITHLRDSVRRSVSVWSAELARSVRRDLIPLVGAAADSAANRALVRLNASLAGPLGETLIRIVTAAADTIIEKAQGAVGEQREEFQSLFDRIGRTGGIIVGGILLLLVGALVVVFINARNSRRALEAVTSVVRDRGSADLRNAIRNEASDRRVEGWLNGYLRKKNLLWRDDRRER